MNDLNLMSIQIGEFIDLDSYYFSKAGNKVHITSRSEVLLNGKYVYTFKGIITKTIPGHEILLNKTHVFDERGKWLKNPGGIHDLSRKGYPG